MKTPKVLGQGQATQKTMTSQMTKEKNSNKLM